MTYIHGEKPKSANAPSVGSSECVMPPLDQLVKRMIEEETREAVARELRQARETLDAVQAAINASEWRKAQEYIIVLNLKVSLLNSNCAEMGRRHNDQAQRPGV